jgi:hypothetical protein
MWWCTCRERKQWESTAWIQLWKGGVITMQYYDFYRHYSVPAQRFQDARVKFSRALEDREEDQYYVGSSYGFTTGEKPKGLLPKLVILIPWFLEEARNQIFGYPKYHH